MIYLLTAIVLTPDGSSAVHICTQKVHRTTQLTNLEECGLSPVFANYTLVFALQLRKKHGKISVRVGKYLSQGRKTSVRVGKPQSGQKNLRQGRKIPQSEQKNLSQSRKTSVRAEKPQSV